MNIDSVQFGDGECAVCRKSKHELLQEEISSLIMPCRHSFCIVCIGQLLACNQKPECPLCRYKLDPHGQNGLFETINSLESSLKDSRKDISFYEKRYNKFRVKCL